MKIFLAADNLDNIIVLFPTITLKKDYCCKDKCNMLYTINIIWINLTLTLGVLQ